MKMKEMVRFLVAGNFLSWNIFVVGASWKSKTVLKGPWFRFFLKNCEYARTLAVDIHVFWAKLFAWLSKMRKRIKKLSKKSGIPKGLIRLSSIDPLSQFIHQMTISMKQNLIYFFFVLQNWTKMWMQEFLRILLLF